jgi:hypothetical protein
MYSGSNSYLGGNSARPGQQPPFQQQASFQQQQPTGFGAQAPLQNQYTGFPGQQPSYGQQQQNYGQQAPQPQAQQPMYTGYQQPQPPQQQLQQQQTGFQQPSMPQYNQSFQAPPVPAIPQQHQQSFQAPPPTPAKPQIAQPTGMTSAQMADSFRGTSSQPPPLPKLPAGGSKIPSIRLSFITAQDQAKFEQLFKSAVGTGSALSGDQARDILLRSKLNGGDLGDIWYAFS